MPNTYRVVDLRVPQEQTTDVIVTDARSPEDAARRVLGIDVARSGAKADLVARVYWQATGQPLTMVRLYARSLHPDQG